MPATTFLTINDNTRIYYCIKKKFILLPITTGIMRVITKTVLILSLISLFSDIASEILYLFIPVYLKEIGFSVFWIGILEGVANFTSGISKGYFGKRSDEKGVRLPFVKLGYFLSAI